MEEFRIESADGTRLAANWHPASSRTAPAVVIVHGFGASQIHSDVMRVIADLQDDDHPVLSFDARGHGRSEGHSTLGELERHDVAAAVAEARERAGRVIGVGTSMGAISLLAAAAAGEGPDGLISVSCPAHLRIPRTWKGLLATGLTSTGVGRAAARRFLGVRISPHLPVLHAPKDAVQSVRVPMVIIHGDRDRIIPASEANTLAAHAPAPSRLHVVSGMGHAFCPRSVTAIREAVRWIRLHPAFVAI